MTHHALTGPPVTALALGVVLPDGTLMQLGSKTLDAPGCDLPFA
jgi:hypothetical protein